MMANLTDKHAEHRALNYNYHEEGLKNWRAWGSWFSWGSPIGLTLGYAIVVISTGLFLWLLALSRHVH